MLLSCCVFTLRGRCVGNNKVNTAYITSEKTHCSKGTMRSYYISPQVVARLVYLSEYANLFTYENMLFVCSNFTTYSSASTVGQISLK